MKGEGDAMCSSLCALQSQGREAMCSQAGAALPTAHPKLLHLAKAASSLHGLQSGKRKKKGIEEAKINITARKN